MSPALLPDEPIPPKQFVEEVLPSVFAALPAPDEARDIEFKLGLALRGADGGEWTLHFAKGELQVAPGLDPACRAILMQSVDDWRAALFEGRPEVVADVVDAVRRADPDTWAATAAQRPIGGGIQNPEALRELETLAGRIDAIVTGEGEPDWGLAIQVGPGPVAAEPRASLHIGAGEAEALRRGELHPLEALITGRLRLEGDLGLILQVQAIAMAASMPPADPPDR